MKILSLLIAVLVTASGIAMAQQTFRGAWVASVHNINFPSKAGLSADAQKAEIVRILDAAKRARLNALMVQVRPEGDALYASQIEPWSRFLTGRQGQSPGYDPLAFFIAEGKKRGIAIHAWINPYRAATNPSAPRAANHITRRVPSAVRQVDRVLIMDPGHPDVQDHVANVIRDIVRRYDVAGVHLDDYFYPYPLNNGTVPHVADDGLYSSYKSRGGSLSKADWRRQNVNTMVQKASRAAKSQRPGVLFGVSPFGIYTRGMPADVKAGVDQYNQLYADPVKWMREGWVDYLAPQLYWQDAGPQSFSSLLRWWRSPVINPRGVPIWPGVAADRLNSHGWPGGEIDRQLSIEKSTGPRGRGGFVLWSIGPVKKNTKNVAAIVAAH